MRKNCERRISILTLNTFSSDRAHFRLNKSFDKMHAKIMETERNSINKVMKILYCLMKIMHKLKTICISYKIYIKLIYMLKKREINLYDANELSFLH